MTKTPSRIVAASLVVLVLLACALPSSAREVVSIDATITSFEKFTSRSGKTHIRFEFTAEGKSYEGRSYAGIVYEGDWSSDTLDAIRSRRVKLVGHWSTYRGKPSFVASRVVRRL